MWRCGANGSQGLLTIGASTRKRVLQYRTRRWACGCPTSTSGAPVRAPSYATEVRSVDPTTVRRADSQTGVRPRTTPLSRIWCHPWPDTKYDRRAHEVAYSFLLAKLRYRCLPLSAVPALSGSLRCADGCARPRGSLFGPLPGMTIANSSPPIACTSNTRTDAGGSPILTDPSRRPGVERVVDGLEIIDIDHQQRDPRVAGGPVGALPRSAHESIAD